MPRWTPSRLRPWLHSHIGTVALGLISYLPLLLTHRGKLGADTKVYLYLDPANLLSKAPYMWDPNVGMGTVTHQNIGYIFPMGPFYWFFEVIGVPDWIAQRIWMGSIIFAAGLGVKYLMKVIHWVGPGATIAAISYAASPYLLHYLYKHSVILLPFAALPWLIALCAQALRHKGWRYPALFALVALTAGGVNATSLVLVMLGPLLWTIHAVFVEKELTIRQAFPPLLRIGLLTLITSLWWMAGLAIQGGYGIDILAYTETYRTVSSASTATEVTRGLGYWFFYGVDTQGPWFQSAVTMTENVAALAVSLLVPLVAIAAVLWTRWRYRIFFVALGICGLVVSVGSHPFDSPTPYGVIFKAFMETGSGLALRSTPRAVPLLTLAMSVFIAAGLAAVVQKFPARQMALTGLAFALIVLNISPMWTGDLLDSTLERDNDVPAYWTELGEALDQGTSDTRVLEVPGTDFADYRWGATVDPITPGLTDRQYVARELVPYGALPSADLINATDRPFQALDYSPDTLEPLMQMMGVGTLVVRADLQYEKYRTPRPRALIEWVAQAAGLTGERSFGSGSEPNRAVASSPLLDAYELGIDPALEDPAPVVSYDVENPLSIVRAVPTERPTIVSGDAAGLVTTAEAGLLDPTRLIVYSGSVTDDPARFDQLVDDAAEFVITDTNRLAARRWGSTRDNDGYTEEVGEVPPTDVSDNRIDLFERDESVYSTAVQRGDFAIRASAYGNPFTYTATDRAFNAADGDPSTAWKVGAFSDVTGEWIELSTHDVAAHTAMLGLSQPSGNRYITKIRVTVDDRISKDYELDETSRDGSSQSIDLPADDFDTLRIEILETSLGLLGTYQGVSGVGFAEITLDDSAPLTEFITPPTDVLDALGGSIADHAVSFIFRRKTTTSESQLADTELNIARSFSLTSPAEVTVSGQARLNPGVADSKIDSVLSGLDKSGTTSSSRLPGSARSRAASAFDGDPSTAWQSGFFATQEPWIETSLNGPTTIDAVSFYDDRAHSVPTRLRFEVDGDVVETRSLDEAPETNFEDGSIRSVEFDPVAVNGSTLRIVVESARQTEQPDWLTGSPVIQPLSLIDVQTTAPLTPALDPADPFPSTCFEDLLFIDGDAVPITLTGTIGDAIDGLPLAFETCEPTMWKLRAGTTDITTADGRTTGLDVDLVGLQTAPASSSSDLPSTESAADLTVGSEDGRSYDIESEASAPYWLVLGQTYSAGWKLTTDDGTDLGESHLVNGFANGWLIDPGEIGTSTTLHLSWAPQRTVWVGLLLSALGVLLCLGLALRPAGTTSSASREPTDPVLLGLMDNFGSPVPYRWTLPLTMASLIAGILFVDVIAGIAVGVLTYLALRVNRAWALLRLLSVGVFGLASAYVVAKQFNNGYPVDFDWPEHFERAHLPIMFAWLLVGVEVTVEAARAGWRRIADLDD